MAFRVREHYDHGYYATHVRRYVTRNRFTRHLLANVFALLGDQARGRVLDLGSGVGTFTIESARRGAFAVGVDAALPALEAARELAAELRAEGARFLAADVAALPFRSGAVDGAICADLTEHLDDETLAALLSEVMRVLRPGGVLALYTPSPTHLFERLKSRGLLLEQDPGHIGLRSMRELLALVRGAGFQVERAHFRPTHLPVYGAVERVLGGVPGVGGLFRRRICVAARKPGAGSNRVSRQGHGD